MAKANRGNDSDYQTIQQVQFEIQEERERERETQSNPGNMST